jgi:hypothetical protein
MLRELSEDVSIGLHLVLCDLPSFHLPAMSYGEFLRRALLRAVPADMLDREIRSQITALRSIFGFLPAHIDGHMHSHQLPGVREALIRVIHEFSSREPYLPWIRSTKAPPLKRAAAAGVASLGRSLFVGAFGEKLAAQCRLGGLPMNSYMAGILPFTSGIEVGRRLGRCVRHLAQDSALLITHPGQSGEGPDPIAGHRVQVHAYLGSDRFLEDLSIAGASLRRAPAAGAAHAS